MPTKVTKPETPVEVKPANVFDREAFFQLHTRLDEYGEEVQDVIYPFAGRVAEFRFLYPDGRIITDMIEQRCSTNFAAVKCFVYRNMEDEQPIATAIATRELDTSSDFGRRFYECAETAAVVRALRLLGIGVDILEEDFEIAEQLISEKKGKKDDKPDAGKQEGEAPAEAKADPGKEKKTQKEKATPADAAPKPVKEKGKTEVPVTDDDAMSVVITTTSSKTLKGKTFAEAVTIAKDMDAFANFLKGLIEKGTPAERKGAEVTLASISG